ncbi:MAG: histidine kinase dimerization/phospho-acceptor domain-containing protein [Chloroflexota bacterium]
MHETVRRGRDLASRARRRDGLRRRTGRQVRASVPRFSPSEVVAHELRTPLTSLLVGGAMLVRDDLHADVRREVARDVAAEGVRLAGAIEDLLALLAADRRPDAPEPLSIPHLLRAEMARAAAAAPGVTFWLYAAPDVPVVVAGEASVVHLLRDLLALAHATAAPAGVVELVAVDAGGRFSLRLRGRPRRRPVGPGRHPVLAEAASRALATRLGADLRLAILPGRLAATLQMPGAVEDPEPRDS